MEVVPNRAGWVCLDSHSFGGTDWAMIREAMFRLDAQAEHRATQQVCRDAELLTQFPDFPDFKTKSVSLAWDGCRNSQHELTSPFSSAQFHGEDVSSGCFNMHPAVCMHLAVHSKHQCQGVLVLRDQSGPTHEPTPQVCLVHSFMLCTSL